jgi:(R,R)-butanediol dehydrogenase/meso-butanediol dehydrogenase/diacetyl reductase
MRAAVYHGQRDVRVEEVPEPLIRPGAVKIAVDWCGICGTDLHEYLEGPIFVPAKGSPHPVTGEELPVVLGHEFAGRVVEVGDGVTRFMPGDHVAVEPTLFCGSCAECRRGDTNLCRSLGFHGLSGGGGGFAEYTVVDDHMVHPLGDMPTDLGALVEPVAVAFHAVRLSGFGPGQTAVVFGSGPIGLATVAVLRAAGARQVFVSEVAEARKAMARAIGVDEVLDPTEIDVVDAVLQRTDGAGADVTFEAAGLDATLTTAIRAARRGGLVCNISIWGHPASVEMIDLVLGEVKVLGTIGYLNDHPATIELMRDKRIDATPFITGRIGLDDIVDGGFHELIDHKDLHAKILVSPTG